MIGVLFRNIESKDGGVFFWLDEKLNPKPHNLKESSCLVNDVLLIKMALKYRLFYEIFQI